MYNKEINVIQVIQVEYIQLTFFLNPMPRYS